MRLTGTKLSLRIFWSGKPTLKKEKKKITKEIWSYQNFTGSYKKTVEALDKLEDTHNIKRYK